MDTDHEAIVAGNSRRGALLVGAAALAAAGMGAVGRGTAAALTLEATPGGEAPVPPDFKVVLHAAQVENWPFVLSNLRNLAAEWPRARIRVVADGSAVTALQGENDLTAELAKLAAAGVEVHVCPNALRDQGIDAATVPAFAIVNLGGVVALVQAQRAGYAYVKP